MSTIIPKDYHLESLLKQLANKTIYTVDSETYYYLPFYFKVTKNGYLEMTFIEEATEELKKRLDIK